MGLSQNRWPFELKNYSLQKKGSLSTGVGEEILYL